MRVRLTLLATTLLLAAIAAWRLGSAQDPVSSTEVSVAPTVDQPVRVELTPGRPVRVRFEARRDDFVALSAEQNRTDLTLELLGTDGRTRLYSDNPEGWEDPEELFFVAEEGGSYALLLDLLDSEHEAPETQLRLTAQRPATERDRKRARALARTLAAERARRNDEYQRALGLYAEAIDLWRALGDRHQQGHIHRRAGRLRHEYLAELDAAVVRYREAIEIFRDIGHTAHEASTLWALGRAQTALGDLRGSAESYDQASGKLVRKQQQGFVFNELGWIYHQLGRFVDSQRALGQALETWQEVGDLVEEATTRHNRGRLLTTLGQPHEARDDLTVALELRERLGDRWAVAETQVALGDALLRQGDLSAALEKYQRAAATQRALGDRATEAITLNNLGLVYRRLGNGPESDRAYEAALRGFRAVADTREEIRVLHNLALSRLRRAEPLAARVWLDEARARLETIGQIDDPELEASLLASLARVERQLGNLEQARDHAVAAIGHIEQLRATPSSTDLRSSFFSRKQSYYDLVVDLAVDLYRKSGKERWRREGFDWSERARARSLLDSLGTSAEADTNDRAGGPSEAGVELSSLADEHLDPLRRSAPTELERRQLRTVQRRRIDETASSTTVQPVTLGHVQKRLLRKDERLLHYHLGKERSYLWVVGPRELDLFVLADRATLEATARRTYRLLAAGERFRAAAARSALLELSSALLAPGASWLEANRLLVSTTGALQYLPFGALPDPRELDATETSDSLEDRTRTEATDQPAPGGVVPRALGAADSTAPDSAQSEVSSNWPQPLLVRNRVTHIPSASVALALRDREPTGGQGVIAAFGDPIFSRSDPRLRSRPAFDGDAPTPYRRLENSRYEVEEIVALGPQESFATVDLETSRDRFTGADVASADWIHIATHGEHNIEFPLLSRLVFSLVDAQGGEREGFLYAFQIEQLDLAARLVVLSACGTGLGQEIGGEGLVGFTQAFFTAGASRVIVSLWDVNDGSTSALMIDFAHWVVSSGDEAAEALRLAQVRAWRERPWPPDWATFVHVGS